MTHANKRSSVCTEQIYDEFVAGRHGDDKSIKMKTPQRHGPFPNSIFILIQSAIEKTSLWQTSNLFS